MSESFALLHEILLIERHFELDLREANRNSMSSRLILIDPFSQRGKDLND